MSLIGWNHSSLHHFSNNHCLGHVIRNPAIVITFGQCNGSNVITLECNYICLSGFTAWKDFGIGSFIYANYRRPTEYATHVLQESNPCECIITNYARSSIFVMFCCGFVQFSHIPHSNFTATDRILPVGDVKQPWMLGVDESHGSIRNE